MEVDNKKKCGVSLDTASNNLVLKELKEISADHERSLVSIKMPNDLL